MRQVLVTGGAGFIGRSLVKQLVKAGYRVICLDNFRFATKDQVMDSPFVEVVDGDTRDYGLLSRKLERVDAVVHLAAASSFIMHEEDDVEMCAQTMMGFKTLMEAIRKGGRIKKIVWASTSAVYELWGKLPREAFREDQILDPPDSKAGSKLWCEQEARRYSYRHGITSIAFRPFSVYGVGEITKLGYANVTSLFTWAMMSGHQPVVWSPGTQTRDFIFVDDVARAFMMAMENDSLSTTEINLGCGRDYTFLEAIEIIGEELDFKPEPVFVDVPIQIYAQKLLADTTRARELLGFTPKVDLREGIRRIIKATNELSQARRAELKLGIQQLYYETLPEKRPMAPLV